MDATTFFAIRFTERRFRDLDGDVSLRRRIAEHLAARRSARTEAGRTHALAA
ncbi:MAG: hypothetical protein ABWY03_04425 [Microbacterium sp.]